MKRYLLLLLLPCLAVIANLPPTTSKGDGETTYKTTFETNYDTIPVTRTGTRVTIGTIPPSKGGTGSTSVPTNGQVPIGNGTTYVPSTITGTTNQVNVTNGSGSITLSTPQDIATSSSPSFDGVTVTNTAHGSLNIGQALNRIEGTYLVSGGVLSIDANPARFDLSAGTGYVTDKSNPASPTLKTVTWSAFDSVAVTNLATADVTYILINDSGAIVQQTTYPTAQQRRDNIFIGRLPHINRTNITFALSLAEYGQGGINQLYDLFDSLGPFKINGLNISANGANLKINLSSGEMFSRSYNYPTTPENPNEVAITGSTAATFRYGTQTTFIQTNVTDINPASYDNAGTVTTVPSNNNATIQRVYLFPTGAIRIYYGQNVYSNFAAAIDNFSNDPFVENPNSQKFATHIASIIITKSCTSLQDTTCSRIVNTGKFGSNGSSGGGSATLQQTYNNSVTPQITTSTSGGSLDVRRGSAADTDNVLRIQNGSGSTTFAITGNGAVTASSTITATGNITGANLSGTNTGDDTLGTQEAGVIGTFKDLSFPNYQVVETNSTTKQFGIDTGNKNELYNGSFEAQVTAVGWTISNATPSANTTTQFEGKKSLSLALTGALSLSQSSTINAARKAGVQMVASVFVKSDDVSDLQLCSLKNGAEDKCTVAGGYVQGSGWRQLTVSFLGDATSNGLKLKSTDTTGTVLVDQAFVGVGSPIVDFTPDMVYSAKISSTGVVSDENTDFINGNCVTTSTSIFTCSFSTSIFSVAPNCSVSLFNNGDITKLIAGTSTSSTQIVYYTGTVANAPSAQPVQIICQKQGADYKTSKAYVASSSAIFSYAYGTPAAWSANQPIIFPTIAYNIGGAYNATTGQFTVPKDGYYQATVFSQSNNSPYDLYLSRNGGVVTGVNAVTLAYSPTSTTNRVSGTGILYAVKGDTLDIRQNTSSGTTGAGSVQFTYIEDINGVIVGSFQGYNETPGVSAPKFYSFKGNSTGVVSSEFGDLINGNCSTASGAQNYQYDCPINSGKITTTPNCVANSSEATFAYVCQVSATGTSSSNIRVICNNSGSPTAQPFQVMCHGQ